MATKFESEVLTALGELKTSINDHSRRLEKIEVSIEKLCEQKLRVETISQKMDTIDNRVSTLETKVDKLRIGVLKICIFIALSGGTGAVGAGIVEFLKNAF